MRIVRPYELSTIWRRTMRYEGRAAPVQEDEGEVQISWGGRNEGCQYPREDARGHSIERRVPFELSEVTKSARSLRLGWTLLGCVPVLVEIETGIRTSAVLDDQPASLPDALYIETGTMTLQRKARPRALLSAYRFSQPPLICQRFPAAAASGRATLR